MSDETLRRPRRFGVLSLRSLHLLMLFVCLALGTWELAVRGPYLRHQQIAHRLEHAGFQCDFARESGLIACIAPTYATRISSITNRSECDAAELWRCAEFLTSVEFPTLNAPCQVTHQIRCLTKLKSIRFTKNRAVGDEETRFLSGLPHLEFLDLGGTGVTDQGVRELANIPSLRTLDLSSTAVSDIAARQLAHMPALESINLSDTKLTDAGTSVLVNIAALKRLDLSGTMVTNEGIATYANLPTLEKLSLIGTQVTDQGIFRLRSSRSLRQLVLKKPSLSIVSRGPPPSPWPNETKVTEEGAQSLERACPQLSVVR